jgi:beta-xylosidase
MLNDNLPDRDKHPLYITEWNLSPSHREWLNDTCYASAYIVRNICKNYDIVDSFCHWTLTDWIEELEFPEELFHGGVGYFTMNGIKKPMYYAYQFLSELEDELLKEGEGYFITKGHDTYSIMLYNFFDVSDSYREGFNFNMSFTDRYHVFVDATEKEFYFDLAGVINGNYNIVEKIVNRQYGSCYDKWVEMGSLTLTTQEELDTLKCLSQPFIKKSLSTADNNILHFQAILEPHEIRLVKIQKAFH